jgi:GLPGLI family protein
MKTLFLIPIVAFLFLSSSISGQSFEGKTIMKTEVVDAPAEMQKMKSMMETTMTTWVKGDKSRMETSAPYVGQIVTITDYGKNESVTCMDMMGQKKAIVSSIDQGNGAPAMPTDIAYKETGNTKKILGRTCHEGVGSYQAADGKTMTMSMWYCKEIPYKNTQYPSLSGMPLEYTIYSNGISMKVTTVEIEEVPVDDAKFIIPSGYERTTPEAMKRAMGGKK